MIPAKYIWTEPSGLGRNRYVMFRYRFKLRAAPHSGKLSLFADTRYRLLVNGTVVGHGPVRFYPAQPPFDTYDLTPYLRDGKNVIAVLVNSYGVQTFQSVPSRGGLIAWGAVRDKRGRQHRLATGPEWRALESRGHNPLTRKLSFALGPAEVLDATQVPAGWEQPDFDDQAWAAAVSLVGELPWGELVPRAIPLLDEREIQPDRLLGAWAAQPLADEEIHSFLLAVPPSPTFTTAGLVQAKLHAPREQDVRFSLTTGECWLNGVAVKGAATSYNWQRFEFATRFQAGENTLLVTSKPAQDGWEFYLGVPRGVTLQGPLLVAGPWTDALAEVASKLALPVTTLPESLGNWRPATTTADVPYIERAWEKLVPSETPNVWLYDFGTEVLGRPVLEFTAPAGTVVDLHYLEHLTADGQGLPIPNGAVRLAERYHARAGRQRWQTFHPRGFRYLEIRVRGDSAAFQLHHVGLTRYNYPVQWIGRFHCSDTRLNRIWTLGRATQFACMEEGFVDCPQREQGVYAGDLLVQFYVNQACFGDTKLMRRCIEVFYQRQNPEGWLGACTHGLESHRHPDYTAIMVINLWQYYRRTGDQAFLRQLAGPTQKILAALLTLERPGTHLIDGTGRMPYIDLAHLDREGVSCPLNCFYYQAVTDAANIADALGDTKTAQANRRKAAAIAAAIRKNFWDASRQLFVDRLPSDVPATEPSVHSNTLPVLFGIATARQVKPALTFVRAAVQHNFRVPQPQKYAEMNVNAYFSFYVLDLLYQQGLATEAADYMRTEWGRMLDAGAWTAWEFFIDGWSRCHAWACCPTHYLSTQVLGVQFPETGNPNRIRLAPQPGNLTWAEGTYPHPAGPIQVEWQTRAGQIFLRYTAPAGVKITVADNVDRML